MDNISRKVTILMPVGDKHFYIRDSLKSIETQTYNDLLLLIICNKCTFEVIKNIMYELKYTRDYKICVVNIPGVAYALNYALNLIDSEYVARWDCDDLCDPDRIERQVMAFEQDPLLQVVGLRTVLIDCNGGEIKNHKFRFYGTNNQIRHALKYRQAMCHSSVMFRTSFIQKIGGYRWGYSCEDHALYLEISQIKDARFLNIQESICYYRRHHDQLTDYNNAHSQYADMAALFTMHMIKKFQIVHLFGIFAYHPYARSLRKIIRDFNKNFYGI